jgi:hypothetical protein
MKEVRAVVAKAGQAIGPGSRAGADGHRRRDSTRRREGRAEALARALARVNPRGVPGARPAGRPGMAGRVAP